MHFCLKSVFLLGTLCTGLSGCESWSSTNEFVREPVMSTGKFNNDIQAKTLSPVGNKMYSSTISDTSKKSFALKATDANAEFDICRSRLTTLSVVDPKAYKKRRSEFDELLRNAALYSRVRGEVDNQTQDTLDPLYQYQTRKVCQRIKNDISEALLRRGESLAGKIRNEDD